MMNVFAALVIGLAQQSVPPVPVTVGQPSMGVYALTAIEQAELGRIGELLELAPPQQAILDQAYRAYAESAAAVIAQELPALEALSVETASNYVPFPTLACAPLMKQLMIGETLLTRRIQSQDSELLRAIDFALTDFQRANVPRVIARRSRQASVITREARFQFLDLAHFAERSGLDSDELRMIDAVLREWESLATPLYASLHDMMGVMRLNAMENVAAGVVALRAGDKTTVARLQAEDVHDSELCAQQQLRLARLNHAYAARIRDALPRELGERFIASYRAHTSHRVFPDPANLRPHLDAFAEAIPDEQARSAATAAWNAYLADYERVCISLVEEHDLLCEYVAKHRGLPADDHRVIQQLRRLRDQRWTLGERIVKLLREFGAPASGSDEASALDRAAALINEVRRQSELQPFPSL